MIDMSCGAIREAIPDYVANRLDADALGAVESHLETCTECASELELVQALYAGRPRVPAGLSARVRAAVAGDRAAMQRPWWGLTAAAVVAVALGIGIVSEPTGPGGGADVPGYAYEVEEGTVWASDDGLVAGAPSLDLLSDEALQQLLDELTVGGSGGAA
jgi:anti-sigma factor RsiW